jgi:hypothetical protein
LLHRTRFACIPGVRQNVLALSAVAPCNAEPRSLPAVVGVHHAASFQSAGRPWHPEQLLETETSALGMGARRAGAAARGAADLRPSRGSTLGCVVYPHAGARIPRTPTWSSALVTRGAAHGVAAASTVPAPKTRHADQFTGSSHGDGEHKGMGGPGAASRRRRSQARLASLCSRPKRAGVRGHSRACARAASPCPARCGQVVASGAARSEVATHPTIHASETAAQWPASPNPSSHGDGGAQEHERLRSPLRRGMAVLRLDGQHPGMF